MREFETIAQIAKWLPKLSSRVEVGIGDDAAILRPGAGKLLVTVDMMVEGVHFDRAFSAPEEIGRKLFAINLSDIAAMGGVPRFAVASLALPAGTSDSFLENFYRGLRAEAERFGVDVVGGNLSSIKGPMALDLCVIGEGERPLTRAGARPGDLVAVTGALGGAAAGLAALRKWSEKARGKFGESVKRQLTPEPRVAEGQKLVGLATSAIDISDGLSSELHHLAKASGCGFRVKRAELPVAADVIEVARECGVDPYEWILHGGEDYELLFTFPAAKRGQAPGKVIGEVIAAGVEIEESPGNVHALPARGWGHDW